MRCGACERPIKSLAAHLRENTPCRSFYDYDDSDEDISNSVPIDDSDDEATKSIIEDGHTSTRVQMVAADLADLRFEHGLNQEGIAALQSSVRRWMKDVAHDVAKELEALVQSGLLATERAQRVADKVDVDFFAALSTAHQELMQMKKGTRYLEPRITTIGSETVASFDLGELFARHLQTDESFRKLVVRKSDAWKTGEKWKTQPTALADIEDGVAMRFHPHLLRPATSDEAIDLRIAINVNADDIEVRRSLPAQPESSDTTHTSTCSAGS